MMVTWCRTLLSKGRCWLAAGSVRRRSVTVIVAGAVAAACAGLLSVASVAGTAGTPEMNWGRAEALHAIQGVTGHPQGLFHFGVVLVGEQLRWGRLLRPPPESPKPGHIRSW